MKRKPIAWFLLAALATYPTAGQTRGEAPPQKAPLAHVVRVVVGDTVVVQVDGKPVTVRLIGVDAPESLDLRKPVERFAHESSEFLEKLIGGKKVRPGLRASGGPGGQVRPAARLPLPGARWPVR